MKIRMMMKKLEPYRHETRKSQHDYDYYDDYYDDYDSDYDDYDSDYYDDYYDDYYYDYQEVSNQIIYFSSLNLNY